MARFKTKDNETLLRKFGRERRGDCWACVYGHVSEYGPFPNYETRGLTFTISILVPESVAKGSCF